MITNFLPSLRAEIAGLEAELESDPRYVKYRRLLDVLALYEGRDDAIGVKSGTVDSSSPASHGAGNAPPIRQPSEDRVMAEKLSAEYVAGKTEPTPTRELYEMLVARGVHIGGKQPTSNLSAILSKSPEFISMGRAGWLPAERSETVSVEEDGDQIASDAGNCIEELERFPGGNQTDSPPVRTGGLPPALTSRGVRPVYGGLPSASSEALAGRGVIRPTDQRPDRSEDDSKEDEEDLL